MCCVRMRARMCVRVHSLFFLHVHVFVSIFLSMTLLFLPASPYWWAVVSGCIWAMLPGAVVKLEQSLQVTSLRRTDNTL